MVLLSALAAGRMGRRAGPRRPRRSAEAELPRSGETRVLLHTPSRRRAKSSPPRPSTAPPFASSMMVSVSTSSAPSGKALSLDLVGLRRVRNESVNEREEASRTRIFLPRYDDDRPHAERRRKGVGRRPDLEANASSVLQSSARRPRGPARLSKAARVKRLRGRAGRSTRWAVYLPSSRSRSGPAMPACRAAFSSRSASPNRPVCMSRFTRSTAAS